MSQCHLSQYDKCLNSICPNTTNVSIPFVPIQQMSQIPLIQFRPAGKFGLKIHLGSIRIFNGQTCLADPRLHERSGYRFGLPSPPGRVPNLSFFYGNPTYAEGWGARRAPQPSAGIMYEWAAEGWGALRAPQPSAAHDFSPRIPHSLGFP